MSVVTRLVLKDIYLARWLIGVALVAGLVSIGISLLSRMAFNVGSVFYLTTVIAYGVMLVMYSVFNERKEKCLLFVLSLPLSRRQYLQAKVIGVLCAFFIPWLVLTTCAALTIVTTPLPDGLLPYFMLVSTFMLMNFSLVLTVALLTSHEAIVTATIILTNLSVTLFFLLLGSIPAIASTLPGDTAVWSAPVFIIFTAQAAVLLLALSLPFFARRNRPHLI